MHHYVTGVLDISIIIQQVEDNVDEMGPCFTAKTTL